MSEPRFKVGDVVEDNHGPVGTIELVHPGENFPYRIREANGVLGSYSDYKTLRLAKDSYIPIPRSELPAATVIDRDGVPHISVEGAEAGTWKASGNHVQARKWALEYLAAAHAMEQWQAGQATEKLQQRRDELAHEFNGAARGYADTYQSTQRAIDRIIELEGK